MNAIPELYRLPENKQQQETFVNAVIGELLGGEYNPLKVEVQLKILEDTIKKIRTDIRVKNLIIEELEKYGKETAKISGAELKLSQRKTYDFSNDNTWKELKAKIKAREAELKELGAIPETGEQVIAKHSEFVTIKY